MEEPRVISYSSEPFLDRPEAGKLLADELKKIVEKDAVVLGIPKGGVVIAKEIAKDLSIEFDIVLSRKIGAPFNPEFAIGAVSENGRIFIDEEAAGDVSASDEYIIKERERELEEIKRRLKVYRTVKPKVDLEDKAVIICDDGIATGATMQASLWAIKQENPKKTIVAVPIAPYDSLEKISKEADETVCLRVPDFFSAVGQFYINFLQLDDREILALLK